jgi:hypothetical protein
MWTTLFWLTNAIAVFGWLLLLFAPRTPLPNSTILYLGVALLCLCYLGMFIGLFGGLADPVRAAYAPTAKPFEYSIAGIQSLFQSDGGIVLGWTHYLAFDLFVGTWIARDADHKGFGRLVQAPLLIVTFLAGPIGLLAWLTLRERRARLSGRR